MSQTRAAEAGHLATATPHSGQTPPVRDLTWWRQQSTPSGLLISIAGGLALGLVVIGGPIVVVLHGLTPVDQIAAALQSSGFRRTVLSGVALGLLALLASVLRYRAMPTKLSREEVVAGGVLGGQAVVYGAIVGWFSYGDVSTFAKSFLDFAVLGPQMHLFVNGAKNTMVLALSGEILGLVLGLLISVLAISRRSVVRAPARVYINFFRGTPLIWQISIIYFGFALGLQISMSAYQAAILAFALNIGAYSAEVFRSGFQSVERGQLEAARGLGLSYLGAMRFAIVPQAIRRVIPPLMNEFVGLVKDTSLVLVLGLTASQMELFTAGRLAYGNTFNATFFVATGLGYLVVTIPLIWLVNRVEKRLRSGLTGI